MTFVKTDPAPLEAAGLRWLAEAGARVPQIVSESPDRLVLQRIEPGRLSAAGEAELGRMLAGLHLAGAPRFGSLPAPGRAYGGHREVDLAMLDLFGRVPARTLSSYDEVHPLVDGWRDRVGLWQLFPLLVHAVLFGGGYIAQSRDLARRLR